MLEAIQRKENTMAPEPVMRVELPALLYDALVQETKDGTEPPPIDVATLVAEFLASLDPLDVARRFAPSWLKASKWVLDGGECSASAGIVRAQREMAVDSKLVAALIKHRPDCAKDGKLTDRARPVLLGLAAACAVSLRAGRESRAAARLVQEAESRSERQRSDAGETSSPLEFKSPSLGGPRPTLESLPHDLRG